MYCYVTARACGFEESCEIALSYLALTLPACRQWTKARPQEINRIRYVALDDR